MDYRVLGQVEVVDGGGHPLDLTGARQRHVLALLLIRRRNVVTAELLIDQLWGETSPPSAAISIQVAISKLRSVLGADQIVTRPGGYRLDVEEHAVDAGRFERRLVDGRATVHSGDLALGARLLREALSLWRGDAFADLAGGLLVEAEATRLAGLRLDAVEALMEAELGRGRHAEIVTELTQLVAAHPFREGLHAHLMTALYRCGRQAEALAVLARARALLVDELGVDPSPELVALEQQILRQDPLLSAPARQRPAADRLPVPLTTLTGRENELEELSQRVRAGARLVTLTGPGGVGKTRLLIALAHRLTRVLDDELDDVVLVELSPVFDPGLVLPTLANALGVQEKGGRELLDNLSDALATRRIMILLDNFEQVLGAATTLGTLLGRCPGLRFLLTSRERLGISGEHEYVVSTLARPRPSEVDAESVSTYSSVQLFLDRAKAVNRDFALTNDNAGPIAELCRRLDGLPLAIELAAARTKLLSPAALVHRLGQRGLSILSGGARDMPERHRALTTTISLSYESLTEPEKRVLQTCSVFSGGATIESLEEVCAGTADADVLDLIGSLLDKSLLTRVANGSDTPRVTMLETVRAFVYESLNADEVQRIHARHADHFATLTNEARTGLWIDQAAWLDRLDTELDNLRAALDWSLASTDGSHAVQMCADLGKYWAYRGAYSEGIRWLTLALTAPSADVQIRAAITVWLVDLEWKAGTLTGASLTAAIKHLEGTDRQAELAAGLALQSDMLFARGQSTDALSSAQRAVEVAHQSNYPLLIAFTQNLLGLTLAESGAPDVGADMLRAALQVAVAESSHYFTLLIRINLGWAEIQRHDYAGAITQLELVTGMLSTHINLPQVATTDVNLGWSWLGLGDVDRARPMFREALVMATRLGDPFNVMEALIGLACCYADEPDPARARYALGHADAVADRIEAEVSPYVADRRREVFRKVATDPGDPSLHAGRRMSLDDILALFPNVPAVEPLV